MYSKRKEIDDLRKSVLSMSLKLDSVKADLLRVTYRCDKTVELVGNKLANDFLLKYPNGRVCYFKDNTYRAVYQYFFADKVYCVTLYSFALECKDFFENKFKDNKVSFFERDYYIYLYCGKEIFVIEKGSRNFKYMFESIPTDENKWITLKKAGESIEYSPEEESYSFYI